MKFANDKQSAEPVFREYGGDYVLSIIVPFAMEDGNLVH